MHDFTFGPKSLGQWHGHRMRNPAYGSTSYGDYFGEALGAVGEAGVDIPVPTSDGSNPVALAEILAPLAAGVTSGLTDPHRQAALLRAQLDIARSKGASLTKIKKLEAKLQAAERKAALADEGVQSTRTWRGLGQVGGLVGIGVGLALVFYLLTKAGK